MAGEQQRGTVHRKWMGPNVWSMRIIGAWNDTGYCMYYCVPIIVVGMSFLNMAFAAKHVICDDVSMGEVISLFSNTILHVNALIENIMLMYNKPLIESLCDHLEMNYTNFKANLEDFETISIRKKVRKILLRFFAFGFVCGSVIATVMMIKSLGKHMDGDKLELVKELYAAVEVVMVFSVNLAIDMMLYTFIMFAAHQLKMLVEMVAVAARAGDDGGNERLAACVAMHCSIKQFARKLEVLLGIPMVFHFMTITFMMCFHMFELATKVGTNESLLDHISAITTVMVVLFIYCKLGEDVKTWSENLRVAVYNMHWFERSSNIKNTALMILINSREPIVIRAGPFYTITFETFLKVVNGSYTYFTIMWRMQL